MFFFDVFINHIPKIHRSILCKTTLYLLYFLDDYDVNPQENNFGRSTTYSCRTHVFISFHHSKEKKTPILVFFSRICETIKNSGGCF